MNKVTTLTLGGAFLVASLLPGQSQAQMPHEVLDVNNISARVNAVGPLWVDDQTNAHFEVPKGSGIHSLFASSLWIGGQDLSGQVKLAAERYRSTGSDFFSGPISDPAHYDPFGAQWHRVWTVTRDQIDQHIAGTSGTIPPEILDWPAHGDPTKGQNYYLAPFIDVNGDGEYNPLDGDYPDIRGDKAVYSIFNDAAYPHTESGGNVIGAEIHLMAYAFECTQDPVLNNTVFLHYRVINASTFSLLDGYMGFWSDGDLGHPLDDLVHADMARGTYLFKNGNANDITTGTHQGYGMNPPAQGVVFLAGPRQDNDGVDNLVGTGPGESINGLGYGDGIVDNERLGLTHLRAYSNGTGPAADPAHATQYYLGLQGLNNDGSTPGNFNDDNVPGDRRILGSCGPFNLAPGGAVELDLALIYSRDTVPDTNGYSVTALLNDVDHVRDIFFTNQNACGGTINSVNQPVASSVDLKLIPNPAGSVTTIALTGTEPNGRVEIRDITGKLVQSEPIVRTNQAVNISELDAGVYLVRWENGRNSVTERLVKH